MDLDKFMMLQNGNLIEIFDANIDVDLNDFKNSKIYKNTNLSNPDELALLKKIARSYKNFCDYLRSDKNDIDYRYLWDLICIPNPKLFEKGFPPSME